MPHVSQSDGPRHKSICVDRLRRFRGWLIQCGHVLECFVGVLSGCQWHQRALISTRAKCIVRVPVRMIAVEKQVHLEESSKIAGMGIQAVCDDAWAGGRKKPAGDLFPLRQ